MREWLERLRTAWANLSPREQILVGGAAVMAAFALLVFAVVLPFFNAADHAHQRALAAEQQLAAMSRLRRDYLDISSRLGTVEERIKNNRERSNIRTLLENLARESAVVISSMEERQAGKNEHYVETKVEVSLKNVTLFQTVKFLHNIESSNRQLSVKSLRIKGHNDQSRLLDVTFAVSSFEPT